MALSMFTVLMVHQIGALFVLIVGSILMAFWPLLLLRWFYKRKKRRLIIAFNQQQQYSKEPYTITTSTTSSSSSSSSSSTSSLPTSMLINKMAIESTLHTPIIFTDLLRSFNGGLLLATLFLIIFPQVRLHFETLMNTYRSNVAINYNNNHQITLLPENDPYEITSKNDTSKISAFLSLSNNPTNPTDSSAMTHSDNQSNIKLPNDDLILKNLSITNINQQMHEYPDNKIIINHVRMETSANDDGTNGSNWNGFISKFTSPIPVVEMIICLAFFTMYFLDEFVQILFHYRKYYWACNRSLVFSSSDGECDYTSLDYRLNCTKRFLIDCSRKMINSSSKNSNYSSPESSFTVEKPKKLKIENKKCLITKNSLIDSSKQHENNSPKSSFLITTKQLVQNNNNDRLESETEAKKKITEKRQENNFEQQPQSLLSNSSVHLPSYYNWHDQQEIILGSHLSIQENIDPNNMFYNTQLKKNCHYHNFYHHQNHNQQQCNNHHHYFHHNSQQLSFDNDNKSTDINDNDDEHESNLNRTPSKTIQIKLSNENIHKQTDGQTNRLKAMSGIGCCCHCHCQQDHNSTNYFNYDQIFLNDSEEIDLEQNQLLRQFSNAEPSNVSTTTANSNNFTKIFLPNTTQSSNMSALYLGEGILIGMQPSIVFLWIILLIMLINKMLTALMMAIELHHKTMARQRHLPSITIILYTALPSIGFLSVIVANMLISWRINLDLAATVAATAATASATTTVVNNRSFDPTNIPIEVAILKVVLISLSSATLLHLIILTIQQRNNFLSSTSSLLPYTKQKHYPFSTNIDSHYHQQHSNNNNEEENCNVSFGTTTKKATITAATSNDQYQDNGSSNNKLIDNNKHYHHQTLLDNYDNIKKKSKKRNSKNTLEEQTRISNQNYPYKNGRIFFNSFTTTNSSISDATGNNNSTVNYSINHDNDYCKNNCHYGIKQQQENLKFWNANKDRISSKETDKYIPLLSEQSLSMLKPSRNNVLHYFIMYSGFILILMAIAFLNVKKI